MSKRGRRPENGGDGLLVGYASRLGAAHLKDCTPNQDSAAVATLELRGLGSIALMAVGDGAGSARLSHFGSRAACDAAVARLVKQLARKPAIAVKQHLLRSALQSAVRSGRGGVVTIARPAQMPGKPLDVREYACTIMVAVVSESLIGVAHVGDGCVVAGDGEQWQILSAPDNGEFANETKFLTNPRNLPRVTVVSRSDISCLAVTTDGLQDVAFSRRSLPYKRFWTPLYRALSRRSSTAPNRVLDALLQKVDAAGKAIDDCTISVCVSLDRKEG